MRFALRTNYGEGAIWLLQDKTVKFPFIEQFNTQNKQPSLLFLFIFLSRKALFYAVYDVSPMAIRYENRLHKLEMRGIMS